MQSRHVGELGDGRRRSPCGMLRECVVQFLEFGWPAFKGDEHLSAFVGGEVHDARPQGVGSHELARKHGVGKRLGDLEDEPVLDGDAGNDHASIRIPHSRDEQTRRWRLSGSGAVHCTSSD